MVISVKLHVPAALTHHIVILNSTKIRIKMLHFLQMPITTNCFSVRN